MIEGIKSCFRIDRGVLKTELYRPLSYTQRFSVFQLPACS